MNDYPAGQCHVVPTNDTKEHIVNLTEACWCSPQVLSESTTHSTHLHHPVLPVVVGHKLAIKKLLIGSKHGIDFQVELPRGPQP